jgi:hypothetical protein
VYDEKLAAQVIRHVKQQGFKVNPHLAPAGYDKITLRSHHMHARQEKIKTHQNTLDKCTKMVAEYGVDGSQIDPKFRNPLDDR